MVELRLQRVEPAGVEAGAEVQLQHAEDEDPPGHEDRHHHDQDDGRRDEHDPERRAPAEPGPVVSQRLHSVTCRANRPEPGLGTVSQEHARAATPTA
ncbi:hypothetical protein GCM10022220_44460 [Actinocatenispora rupis]|uniref:Uncharacterized protein n=1 Tax=Actinocatenispora rupis TaxID=519421 RepID=A0A8J3J6F2_9ACTN|nr:hypothetical protein Aru02nite_58670 [Actinocatenispora rupis]